MIWAMARSTFPPAPFPGFGARFYKPRGDPVYNRVRALRRPRAGDRAGREEGRRWVEKRLAQLVSLQPRE
jgi:hypothetical protein